jgi:hypothetical protein
MRVIPPIVITDGILTTSSIAEPSAGETLWSSATAYAVGTVVILTSTHRKYECLVANTNFSPDVNLTGTAPKWLDVGPTNKWAMFDAYRNSPSTATSSISVQLTPGKRIDSIALTGVQADIATITLTVGGVTKYTYTEPLVARRTTTWSNYFFGTFTYIPSLVRFDIPPYSSAVITITLTKTGTVQVGSVVIGTSVYLGSTQYNATSSNLNFSTITRDAFGNATLIPRRAVPKTDQTLFIAKELTNSVRDVRTSLNAVPAIWSGLDDNTTDAYFEAFLILGIYKEFSINVDQPEKATITLQLEEI